MWSGVKNKAISQKGKNSFMETHTTTTLGENIMADIITGTTTGFVNNIPDSTLNSVDAGRRESAAYTGEIIKEGLKEEANIRTDVKDVRHALYTQIDSAADRLQNDITSSTNVLRERAYDISRDTMDLRAQVTSLGQFVKDNAQLTALQTEKAVMANTIEGQKNTTYLSDKISNDGEKTRALINDLKYHDLNRALVERNAELVEERHWGRHWRDSGFQNQWASQFAALQSQLQAFNSQLQETRQGMVNFGTMAGVGQSSTSNNVR